MCFLVAMEAEMKVMYSLTFSFGTFVDLFPQSSYKIRYDDVISLYFYHFLSFSSFTKMHHFQISRGL